MSYFLQNLQQNGFVIIIAIIGAVGCLAYSMAGKGLSVLQSETLSMTTSVHPFIKQIKMRRENGMRINANIRNNVAFVAKYLDKYTYCNLTVRDYVRIAWLIKLLCVMLGLVGGAVFSSMWYPVYGIICAIAVFFVGKIEDIEQKKILIIVNIVDYFDNILTFDKKIVETEQNQGYNEDGTQIETDISESEFADAKEKQKLIEDVLKEYLA